MKQSIFAFIVLLFACRSAMQTVEHSTDPAKNTLISILSQDTVLQSFVRQKDELHLQVIYTRIDRDAKNNPHFTDYTFNTESGQYFYPASTVKMPISFLALEKLKQLQDKGINKYTTMVTDSSYQGESVVYTHPTAQDSKASVAQYIKEIFLVSDNDAFNRLYEFLGQSYINTQLQNKGLIHSYIRHRLAVVLNQEQNRHTNPVHFFDTAGNLLFSQEAQYSSFAFPSFNDKLGRGYYSGNQLVNAPFDFSLKNHVSLQNLHQTLKSFLFPSSVSSFQQFDITEDDRQFVLRCMSSFPRESQYPSYDPKEYPDDYCKFFGRKMFPNNNIRIFSKSGWAYGFLTDIAYVVDFEHHVEFMLSATILCNSDGIFNDDHYDFEQTGYPFMQQLGYAVYQYELQRKRNHQPDLSAFRFDYSGK